MQIYLFLLDTLLPLGWGNYLFHLATGHLDELEINYNVKL